MFCGKCGAQNPDGAAFCASCGAPLDKGSAPVTDSTASAVPGGGAVAQTADQKKYKTIGIAAIGAVALIVVVVLLSVIFSGRSANSTAEKFMKATFQGDGEEMVDLLPKGVIKYYAEQRGVSEKEAREILASQFDSTFKGVSGIWETSKIKISTDVEGDEEYGSIQLGSIKTDYTRYDVKVKDAKTILLDVTIKYNGEKVESSSPIRVPVIKVGGSWYIDYESMGSTLARSIINAFM